MNSMADYAIVHNFTVYSLNFKKILCFGFQHLKETHPLLLAKVSTVEEVAWQNSTLQIFIFFPHFFVPFGKEK